MTNLERKFKQNNLKSEYVGNKIYITSGSDKLKDRWFVCKSDKKLILFHRNRYKNRKGDFHKQIVCYNYDDIIKTITEHDRNKEHRSKMDNLYNMIESGHVPKFKII